MDILKKKYINAEVPVKSSNVFSLTTSRNSVNGKITPTKSIASIISNSKTKDDDSNELLNLDNLVDPLVSGF